MDLQDQLKNLFPDHEVREDSTKKQTDNKGLWIPDDPVECHFEKRRGKATTIIKGYSGNAEDFDELARDIKKMLGIGGSTKNGQIILQGDYRDRIMKILKDWGFKVKRVGG